LPVDWVAELVEMAWVVVVVAGHRRLHPGVTCSVAPDTDAAARSIDFDFDFDFLQP
jgi:hypothetical protein